MGYQASHDSLPFARSVTEELAMNDLSVTSEDRRFQRRAIEASIRIGLIVLLVLWCFNIVRPFVMLILWGAIIAVAIYPLFLKFTALLGNREKLAATLMTLIALAMLITPTVMLSGSAIESSQALAEQLEAGTLRIPPPSDKVRDWPLIGQKTYDAWNLASRNLEAAISKFSTQLSALGKYALSAAAGAGATVLQFVISVIIAGVLLVYAGSGTRAVERLSVRLIGGEAGRKFADMAGATIRSVAQGVLGVALIQAILAGLGLVVMGVPYAGLLTLAVLLLAIVQLPTIIVLAPVILYVFSTAATVPAVLFTIWSLLVGISDSFLKPLLLGRGLDIPMPVILLGAIGGMIMSGIIGLFVGAVVLAVGYTLYNAWLAEGEEVVEEAVEEAPAGS
jgi:predicted PurR-regulated permease PerM